MKNVITSLLFIFALATISNAQEHSGSHGADRNPYIAMYTGDDGSELLVWTSQFSAMGYYKKDGKLDSIKMGSFTKDDVGLYLKSGNQFDGTFKTEESFDVKVLNDDYKKIGKIKFTRKEFKSLDINAQIKDQEKFTQESGIATFNLGDGSELLFALWWEFRATLNHPTDAIFYEIQGIANKTKSEGGFDYYKYVVYKETDPESNLDKLNRDLHFKVETATGNITFWIDAVSDNLPVLSGLKNKEQVKCIKKN